VTPRPTALVSESPHPGRWRTLALVSVAELLGMSVWFAAAAVAPHLRERWALSISEAGWLTTVVQLGFVAGTACAAVFNLADLIPARRYFTVAALLAALANAVLLVAPTYATALGGRFLTGFFLAGVYPPAMKMIATWFRSLRGLAIGTVVGALTVGKATPYLVHAASGVRMEAVVITTTLCTVLAAVLVAAGYREGPFPFERRAFSLDLALTVWRHRETRLAIAGYLGHMWELYAMWTWIPAFMVASAAARAAAGHGTSDPRFADLMAFAALAAGGVGCVWAGLAARTLGYARVVQIAMALSGACSLLIGLCFGATPWLLVPVALVWGFFVVADSAQFSAMVTEAAPRHAVGTALTLQTSMGFLLTMVTMQMVPWIVGAVGWRWAFAVLAIGPALGIAAIERLRR